MLLLVLLLQHLAPSTPTSGNIRSIQHTVQWFEFRGRPWACVAGSPRVAPPIIVREDSLVNVTVWNKLLYGESVTIHHHGLHQLGTPYYDGVSGVSQPVIPVGGRFTYQIKASPPGTHYYHAHAGLLASDGLRGAFVVLPKQDVYAGWFDAEHTLLLSEFQFQTSASALQELVNDTYKSRGDEPHSDIVIDDVLVNGASLDVLTLRIEASGSALRLRLINAGSHWALNISIDSHRLLLLALDGYPVEPLYTDAVIMYPGERADVLLRANPAGSPGDEFGIQIGTLNGHTFKPGVLSYANATVVEVAVADGVQASIPVVDTANGTVLESLYAHPQIANTSSLPPDVDRVIELSLGGMMQGYEWWINGRRFKVPSSPLTVDPTAHGHVHAHGSNVWEIGLGETVDLLIHNPTVCIYLCAAF